MSCTDIVIAFANNRSLILVTCLQSHISHGMASKVAHHAHKKKLTLKELNASSADDFGRYARPELMIRTASKGRR